jgi:hypothetical protein
MNSRPTAPHGVATLENAIMTACPTGQDPMNSYDDDDSYEERDYDDDSEDTVEKHVWQLLLMINPGDEEAAKNQFNEYGIEVEDQGDDDPVRLVGQVTNWRSSFEVDADDTRGLVEALNELISRFRDVTMNWGGDPDDDEYHEDIDAAEIFNRAYDQLKPYGYTLWSREADDDVSAGWITSSSDDESMLVVATALHINLRRGDQLS